MGKFMQNMAGMGDVTEQVIAADFMVSAKTGMKNYAAALSETATPEVRNVLRRQFEDAVNMHEKITDYMMQKGYYQAYNPAEQIKMDMQAADTVLNLGQSK